jgi:hypothetical protein
MGNMKNKKNAGAVLVRPLLRGSLLCCGGCRGSGLGLRVILVTWRGLRRKARAQTGIERVHLTRSWWRTTLCGH